jgi:WD40 repeat protein
LNSNFDKSLTQPTKHTKTIFSLLLLPNASISSASYDSTIQIWKKKTNANGYELVQILKEHKEEVYSQALLSNNDFASGSLDGRICIWSDTSKKSFYILINSFVPHLLGCFSLIVLKNSYLVSSGKDKDRTSVVKIWMVDDYDVKLKQKLEGHSAIITSLCSFDNGDLLTGSSDKTIKHWQIAEGGKYILRQTLAGHRDVVSSLAINNRGEIISGSYDKSILIWHRFVDQERMVYTDFKIKQSIYAHQDIVWKILTFKNRTDFLTCSNDKSIRSWAINSEQNGSQKEEKFIEMQKIYSDSPPVTMIFLGDNVIATGGCQEVPDIKIYEISAELNELYDKL